MGNTCSYKNINRYNMEYDDDAPMFSLNGLEIEGKVVSVYDGDTVKIVFPFKDTMYKWNCRLSGIDTPELRTKCEAEKEFGYKVRDILREKILNKMVRVRCGEFDKYGRLITQIICLEDNCIVNNWLIQHDYALAYDGGTKQSWSEILTQKDR